MTTKLNANLLKAWPTKVDEAWYGPRKSTSKTIYSFAEAWRMHNRHINILRKSPVVPQYALLAAALERCEPKRRCRKKRCFLCNRARSLMLEANSATKAAASLNVASVPAAAPNQECR